ncbi:hypothetical protein F4860DRAFT_483967 [Xylaria cubensis]|nr:hypothetical protein F4860DRAFT_483967 [Xylaria cubensis]
MREPEADRSIRQDTDFPISLSPATTKHAESPDNMSLWEHALQKALRKLPPNDSQWLRDIANREPFTSTQMLDRIRSHESSYSSHPVQKFLARIDPIVSHIRSFTIAITAISNADPTRAGVVWGSVSLVLIVAGKTQEKLEMILDVLSEISPQLALFARWHRLFPHKSFSEVGEAIQDAYLEIIEFCVVAVRYLRRNPLKNILHAIFDPSEDQKLKRHETMLRRHTARVKSEVDIAHMQFVQAQLAAIGTVVIASPTPQYMELPVIRLIPHSRNDRFFGRQEILQKISKKLNALSTQQRKQQRFVLCGPGGSGKTQIALEYTYQHLEDYKVVIWILADSLEKMNQGFGDAAGTLGMPRGTQGANEVRAFVLHRLSAANEPYLLCFDNVDDISIIKGCLPRDNRGSILVTSRDSFRSLEAIGDGLTVPEFSIREGCNFLSSMLPDVDRLEPDNQAVLEEISTTFHGYPLALAQAAAFIRNGGSSLTEFPNIFRNRKHSVVIASIPIDDYHATLFTVLDLSFRSLGKRSRQILDLLVYLDPDSVPYEILQKNSAHARSGDTVAKDLSFMADPVEFWDALQGLRSQSLIRTNSKLKSISIHRFLQDQVYRRLCDNPMHRRNAFENVLALLSSFQPEFPNVTQHWSPDLFKDSETSLAHIKMLAERYEESPETFKGLENRLGKLIFESASYQFERFHHQAATAAFELARKFIRPATTPNELYLSDCYRMEGRMFNESGQAIQGAESNRHALTHATIAIKKRLIRDDDQRIPRIMTGLGNSLSQLGAFDEALDSQLEAKKLCGNSPPEQSDVLIIIQLNLGFLLFRRGDLVNAERVLRATLEISPKTPPVMYALGNTLLAKDSIEEAVAVHLEGLEIYISMFGAQHALVARCAYKVGEVLLLYQDNYRTARTYLRKAIDIYEKQESAYYTVKATARATRMLARALEMDGREEEATVCYEKAWSLREQIDGVRGSRHDDDSHYSSCMFYWDQ